jgi:hypothetical protein
MSRQSSLLVSGGLYKYIFAVRPAVLFASVALLALVDGCGSSPAPPVPRSSADAALFAPVSMRVHPIFTQVKDWTGDNRPDGVEALLEFQDQFGDPTKAAGTAVFELYNYRRGDVDPRGERVCNPWVGSLQTLDEQQARWNRTSRTYFFQLEYPGIRSDRNYVLTATFDTGGTRFFDQIVIQGEQVPRNQRPATTVPSTHRAFSAAYDTNDVHRAAAARP